MSPGETIALPAKLFATRRLAIVALLLGWGGPALAAPLEGMWSGSYVCPQGLTPLELFVTGEPSSGLRAYFHFGDGSLSRPEGCFSMRGTLAGSMLSFEAAGWFLRPEHYRSVDLGGRLDGARYSGSVTGPGCTTFDLEWHPAAPLPTACQPRGSAIS